MYEISCKSIIKCLFFVIGTDVSGGYSVSIQDALRKSIETSKMLSTLIHTKDYTAIHHNDAFYLATLGGAKVMNLDHRIGNFIVGKEFDALVISPDSANSPFDTFDVNTPDDRFQKFLFCGDDRNIKDIYVAGRLIDLNL